MSPEKGSHLADQSEYSCNSLQTDLTLALPGGGGGAVPPKRRWSGTVGLSLGAGSDDEASVTQLPPPKPQIVGWPPLKSCRKNMIKSSKFVKVAVDGAPYLRKLDLEICTGYQELLAAFEDMFTFLTICDVKDVRKIMDSANGTEYVPTYEDKDGDWMLVGDVPWKMFVESCKRMRLMKSSEAIGLAPKSSISSRGSSN